MIILDTSVLVEAFRPKPSKTVMRWLTDQEPASVFTTTIAMAEILYAVEGTRGGKRKARLSAAVEQVFAEEFRDRILPFDEDAARLLPKILAGRDTGGRPISQLDGMIAAITHSRRAALATGNTRDFEGCGIRIVNPWAE
jgi:predicted nucleic acid-binding protein